VDTERLAINFRNIKGGGIIPRVLSEENCSIYIEFPANNRAEHGLRRSLRRFIYLIYRYRSKGESDAEISLNKVLQG
jgi:hypothetical protein